MKFEGADDKFTETVLITLTGIAREYTIQKKREDLKIKISGNAESDDVYKRRAAEIKTYLSSQGLPAGRIQILERGQLPSGKNIQPEKVGTDTLQVYLMR